jgi:hypothetical protein
MISNSYQIFRFLSVRRPGLPLKDSKSSGGETIDVCLRSNSDGLATLDLSICGLKGFALTATRLAILEYRW